MRAPQVARLALGFLVLSTLLVGLTAAIAPATFYDDFPFVTDWVNLLPPYNEHLVTDIGGLYLGFAVLFIWAAATLERVLVRAVCFAWLIPAALHFTFHASHLEDFSTADASAELVSLALLLVAPVAALWATAAPDGASPERQQP